MFLVNKSAAILVEDKHTDSLLRTALDLLKQENQLNTISKNAKKMGKPNASDDIILRKYLNLFLNEFRYNFKSIYFIGIGGIGECSSSLFSEFGS